MKDPDGEPFTILFVEDDPGHAELVRRSFEEHRVVNRLCHVSNGEDALDYLLRQNKYTDAVKSPKPHVVLLDLRIPKIDGLEVLKTIRTSKQLDGLPIVILTTSEAEKDVATAYEYNASSYLVKPVDFTKFTGMMKDVGFYWLGWNLYPWGKGQ
ncbi:response regulator [Candidatus Riflebacteria bacterium]